MKLKNNRFFFNLLVSTAFFFSLLIVLNNLFFSQGTLSRPKLNLKNISLSEKIKVLSAQTDYTHIFISEGDSWYGSGGVISLASTDEPAIKIGSYKLSGEAEIEIYRANVDAVLNYLLHNNEGNQINKKVDTGSFQYIGSTKEKINSGYSNSTKVELPIEQKGIYYLKIKLTNVTQDAFIVRSETGAIVKEGDNEFIFWGQNFSSRRSVNEGEITLYNLQDNIQELSKVNFDSEGVAKTNLISQVHIGLARVGDDISLIPINLRYLNRGHTYSIFQPKERRSRLFVFSDRPIYKPGDKIYFKSIIRDDDDARYSIPSGTAQVSISKSYSGEEPLSKKNYPISSLGTLSGEFNLPADIKTGHYYLQVDLAPETNNYSLKGSISFQVEHFRKPEYFVEILSPKQEYIAGDKSFVTVRAEYFFGQPVSGQKIKYKIFSADFYEYYYRGNTEPIISDDYRYSYWSGRIIKEGQVKLNQQGEAKIDIDFVLPKDNYKSQVYSIEAELDDGTGNPSFARKNILVYSGEYGIFREDWSYGSRVGETVNLNLKLVSRLGGNTNQIPLKAKVKRTTWIKHEDTNKKYPTFTKKEENLPDLQAVSDNQGKASFTFNPQNEGSYQLTVEGKDSRGNSIIKNFSIWVVAKDKPLYTGAQQDDGLSLHADKEKYSHTDTAKLTITSEIADRDAFLSLDRARVNRFQVVRLNGHSATIDIPLVETDIPNIFAKVASFSDYRLESDSKNLIVSSSPKKLRVTLTTDKEKYGPGESVTVNVQTTDVAGNPVSANLAIWAVDKAIFELVNQNYPKVFEFFWKERYDDTAQAHSLQGINVAPTAEMGGCFGPDTLVLMANGKTKKIKDIKSGDTILTRRNKNDPQLVRAKVTDIHSQEVAGYFIINQHLKVTPNHRIWINGEWQEASKIQLGDVMLNNNNQSAPVFSLEWQNGKLDVYNLTVEKYQTYFAGSFWVHNQKGGGARIIFKDTAYWNPSLQTDGNGQAQIKFELADNLTTWVLASIGSTLDTKVGETTNDIVVTKDVVIRPILPNIFRTDDRVVLSALVQNFTDQEHPFEINFKSESLEIESQESIKKTIPANGIEQVYWQAKPKEENEKAKLTFSAKATDESRLADTIIQELPIRLFGFWEKRGQNAEGATEFDVKLADDSHQEKSKIALSLSPTLLGTLPTAMKYLINYPYGCVEQTTSRFVPAVIAKANPNLFGEAMTGKNIDDILKKGVKKLTELQKPEGGWTWWYAGRSDPFITTYVVEYLLEAQKLGVKVDDEMIEKAKIFLEKDKQDNKDNAARKYGLTLLGSAKTQSIAVDLNDLTPDLLALAVMANLQNGDNNPQTNGLKLLLSQAKTQGDGVYWQKGDEIYFGSDDASTALALRAIVASESNREMAVKASRYLLSNRKVNYWSNTFATAKVIRAAVDFAKAGGELAPNYTYIVKLDGQEISKGNVTNSMQILKDIEIKGSEIKKGGSQVTIQKLEGKGNLYSTLLIEEFQQNKKTKAVDHGFIIKREYVNQKGAEYNLGVGDIVDVKLTVSGLEASANYGVIADELPTGMIPINPSFKNEQLRFNRLSYQYGVGGQEVTENGMILSLYRMNPGTQVYTYQARVISEGEFLTPPATVSLMYSPEIYGRTGVQKIKIEKESRAKLISKEIIKKSPRTLVAVGVLLFSLTSITFLTLRRRSVNLASLKEKISSLSRRKKPSLPKESTPPYTDNKNEE